MDDHAEERPTDRDSGALRERKARRWERGPHASSRRTRVLNRRVSPLLASLGGRLRRRRVVHLLHIRKTGGSAVKVAIRGDVRGAGRIFDGIVPGTRLVLHGHATPLAALPPRDEVVFFLRDPVARFISGFNDRAREGLPRYHVPWRPGERSAFERFPAPDDLAVALGSDAPDVQEAAWLAMRQIRHVNSHLADWLGDPELLRRMADRILLVGWSETLADDFERLRALLDLPDGCHLPEDPDVGHRAPGGQSTLLSPTGVANLCDWYAADHEIIAALESLGLTRRPVIHPTDAGRR